ncbi:MAG: glycoside hydrolase family 95 protein, partial [Oscillospiraceae bacterium]|nr:glycoside hydrolase family 95 protein [Oscillospiraceae bacterium]
MTGPIAIPAAAAATPKQDILKAVYSSPALDWESEGMPIGNGHLGGVVFGGVEADRIQFNEHTVWSGGPGSNPNYGADIYRRNTPAVAKSNLVALQNFLQNEVMNNFTPAYKDGTGKIITQDYPNSMWLNDGVGNATARANLEQLKGEKWNFGSYQTLGDIYISDIDQPRVLKSKAYVAGDKSAESEGFGDISWNLFDTTNQTRWTADDSWTAKNNQITWPVNVDWEYDRAFKIDSYKLVSNGENERYDPRTWTLYGSVNGTAYTVIHEQNTNYQFSGRRQTAAFNVAAGLQAEYKYYRLSIFTTRNGTGGGRETAPSLCNIILNNVTNPAPAYSNYSRELDLNTGMAGVRYTRDGVTYKKEYFTSYPGNVMAIRLTADGAGRISQKFSINSPHALPLTNGSQVTNWRTNAAITATGDTITMTGSPVGQYETVRELFATQLKVVPKNGTMTVNGNAIEVTGADEVWLFMSAKTNYQLSMDAAQNYFTNETTADLTSSVKGRLDAAAAKGMDGVLADHLTDYQGLFGRVNLRLNDASFPANKTTDQLLAGYKNGSNTDVENRYLEMLYYQFGRYLLVASSREGSLPANLQGIWAQSLQNSWDSDYHTNINMQMNYWPAEQANLAECHRPVFDYVRSLIPRGTQTAR